MPTAPRANIHRLTPGGPRMSTRWYSRIRAAMPNCTAQRHMTSSIELTRPPVSETKRDMREKHSADTASIRKPIHRCRKGSDTKAAESAGAAAAAASTSGETGLAGSAM